MRGINVGINMEPTTTNRRIELAFKFWIEEYNQDKYEYLSSEEREVLVRFHFDNFMDQLKNICAEDDPILK